MKRLNIETIEVYMLKVYGLIASKFQINYFKKMFLRIAHTINRFTNSIKPKKIKFLGFIQSLYYYV